MLLQNTIYYNLTISKIVSTTLNVLKLVTGFKMDKKGKKNGKIFNYSLLTCYNES